MGAAAGIEIQLAADPEHHLYIVHCEKPQKEHLIWLEWATFIREFPDFMKTTLHENKNVLIFPLSRVDCESIQKKNLKKFHFFFEENTLIYLSKALKNRVPEVQYNPQDFNDLGQFLQSYWDNTRLK